MSMRDYEVNTAVLFNTGFDDRECNWLMFEGMKGKIVNDISRAFEKDKTLSEYINSNLDFTFTGYKGGNVKKKIAGLLGSRGSQRYRYGVQNHPQP